MASIEERVISLKLDNKDFSKSCQEVIKSLETLSKAITNLSKSAKSFSDLEKAADKLDFSGMSKSANKAAQNVDKSIKGIKFDSVSKNADQSFSNVEKSSEKVRFSGLSSMLSSLNSKMSNALSGIKFGPLANQADKAFSDIDKSAKSVKFDSLSDNASKAMSKVESEVNDLNFGGAISAIETLANRFTVLGTVGINVLSNIANRAVSTGTTIAKSITLDPIIDGFKEYETQMGAVQTILANTASKGTTLDQVNQALNTLNTYADKTIYNFTEMTKNIGTFTAAGVDLQTSVNSIQGIANLAAVSGSTSQQASTAMYQLSQALAAGTVKLMDWNSVVNAGMGGEVFQSALIRTSEHLHTGAKEYIAAEGSFRDSLQKGWLTSDVLTETLNQFALATDSVDQYNASLKSLVDQGYSEEEAKQIVEMAKTASDAATKVKTFSQLIDTLKEALGSGWTQTWQTFIGDFEEAKDLWTGVSDALSGFINNASNARNAMLSEGLSTGWNQFLNLGITNTTRFKEILTDTARQNGVAIDDMINKNGSLEKSFKENWVTGDMLRNSVKQLSDEMGGMSAEQLKNAGYTAEQVRQIQELNTNIENGSVKVDEFAEKMARTSGRQRIINGLANAFKGLGKILEGIGKAFREVFPQTTGDQIYAWTKQFEQFSKTLIPTQATVNKIATTFKGLFAVLDIGKQLIVAVAQGFAELLGASSPLTGDILDITSSIGAALVKFDEWIKSTGIITKVVNGLVQVLKPLVSGLTDVSGAIATVFSHGIGNIVDVFSSIFGTISKGAGVFDVLVRGFELVATAIKSILDGVGQNVTVFGTSLADAIKSIFSFITNNFSISDLAAVLGISGIIKIVKAVTNGVDSITKSFDKFTKDVKKTLGYSEEFKNMMGTLKDTLISFQQGVKATTLLQIGAAIFLLASAMEKMSKLSGEKLITTLAATGAMLAMLSKTLANVAKVTDPKSIGSMLAAGVTLMAMAKAVNILVKAVMSLAKLDEYSLLKGVVAVRAVMSGLGKSMATMGDAKSTLKNAVTLIAMAKTMQMVADAMVVIAKLSWEEIGKGLAAMGGTLVIFGGAIKLAGNYLKHGTRAIKGAAAILIASKAMADIGNAMAVIGKLKWEEIGRGLSGIAGALATFGIVLGLMGRYSKGNAMIKGAAAILIASYSLENIGNALAQVGNLSWDQISRGLAGISGALATFGLVLGLMGRFAGFGSLEASVALLIAVQALQPISDALLSIGVLPWESIAKGLVGITVSLAVFGTVLTLMGRFAGLSSIGAAAAILIAAQALDPIATTLYRIGNMSWDEIARGLHGMISALTVMSLLLGLLGKLGGLSSLAAAASLLMVAQTLDPIATSLQKIGKLSWDEITRGLVGLGGALTELGLVVGLLGTLAPLSALGGAGLLVGVQSLDQLASALERFGSMSWDEIARGLSAMGGALAELTGGTILMTLGVFGASVLNDVVPGVSALADAMKKWQNVSVPEDMADQLGRLADGVKKFTFAFGGAFSIALLGDNLGVLAVGAAMWQNITIPDSVTTAMGNLADGVKKFNFAFGGAFSIAILGDNLTKLAVGAAMWQNITIPSDVVDQFGRLAEAVKKFDWLFTAGWSLSTIAGPLGALADGVKKWKDVKIPDNLVDNLGNLADGVGKFNIQFFTGGNLNGIVDPFGRFAGAVKKWENVKLTGDYATNLGNLASGIGKFNLQFFTGGNLNNIITPLGNMAGAVNKWNNVTVPANIGDDISKIASAVKNFTGTSTAASEMSMVAPQLKTLANAIVSLYSVNTTTIGNKITNMINAINGMPAISSNVPSELKTFANGIKTNLETAKTNIDTGLTNIKTSLTNLSSGITTSMSGVKNAADTQFSGISNAISTANTNVTNSATTLANTLSGLNTNVTNSATTLTNAGNSIGNGISNGITKANTALDGLSTKAGTALDTAAATISGKAPTFKTNGEKLGQAVVNGAGDKLGGLKGKVSNAVANAANGVDTSKFYTIGVNIAQGMANGIAARSYAAVNAAADMAARSVAAAKNASGEQSPSKYTRQIGVYFDQGMINGINALSGKVGRSAAAMAENALAGVQNALDVHSPSRSMQWVGEMTVLGFTNALKIGQQRAYESGAAFGKAAHDGTQSGIAGFIQDLNDVMDLSPTITPVMDLSQIQNGVDSMTGMIDQMPSIGTGMDAMLARRAGMAMGGMKEAQVVPDNTDVVNAVNALAQNIDQVSAAVSRMQVNMDGKALVGSIQSRMDSRLGREIQLKGRYI